VRLLGLAPTLIDRFLHRIRELEDAEQARARRQFATGATFGLTTTVLLCALLGLVASRGMDGRLTIGDIAVFAAVGPRLRSVLHRLVLTISRAVDAILEADAVRVFLAVAVAEPPASAARVVAPPGGIEVQDVWFTYPGAARPALSGVSLVIRPGEIVGLAGGNGAGKTTLVKLLAGLYMPQKGRILVDGRDLREWPFEDLRKRLVLVSPDSPRFEATARDNIAFGRWPELAQSPQAVEKVAAEADVHRLLRDLPRGYETTLGQLFGERDLSSGEWQQVILARALARPASVWLLDEPTAHVDERAERHQLERLRTLAGGRSMLLASHRPQLLAMADRIVTLEGGRVVQSGSSEEMLGGDGAGHGTRGGTGSLIEPAPRLT
jgi:ATP-binding cassette subfamily B protein